MEAIAIPGSISVISHHEFEGYGWLHVACVDHDAFTALPAGVTFMGRAYGRTGWNSDHNIAYYSTGKSFAVTA